ncbi:hypothetical protein D3C85_1075810 [compost metagenome]
MVTGNYLLKSHERYLPQGKAAGISNCAAVFWSASFFLNWLAPYPDSDPGKKPGHYLCLPTDRHTGHRHWTHLPLPQYGMQEI